jgi:hypothetical protein
MANEVALARYDTMLCGQPYASVDGIDDAPAGARVAANAGDSPSSDFSQ